MPHRLSALIVVVLALLTRQGVCRELSSYERSTLKTVLKGRGQAVDRHAEGKWIEAIDIQILDVIEQRDPLPGFLNALHVNTKTAVVERALLFRQGERYRSKIVFESERALRGFRQHSLVVAVPLTGSRPDRVSVLVLVKDVWSLRLNSAYRFRAGELEYLLLQPSEENLLGMHRSISVQGIYQPDTFSFGVGVAEPRLAGSRILARVEANMIVNHRTGELEGSFGGIDYGLPLFSTRQRWAWGSRIQWRRAIARSYVGVALRTFDADATQEDDAIPVRYSSDALAGRFSVVRSFGYRHKLDIRIGAGVDRRQYATGDLSAFRAEAVQEFKDTLLPTSDTRNGPFVEFRYYDNIFARLHDLESLGLEENYGLGLNAYLRMAGVSRIWGASRDYISLAAAASYTVASNDFLARIYGAASVEKATASDTIFQSNVTTGLRAVSPRFKIGRLVSDLSFSYLPHNYLNRQMTLGGEGRLRGYATGRFIGQNLLASNLEFRSRSLRLWTVQLGGALFYDVADVFDELNTLRPKQGAGFGLRLLLPMFGRSVMRLDWGFALTREFRSGNPFEGLVFTFQQSFGMPRATANGIALGQAR